jgi:hypothetical protein
MDTQPLPKIGKSPKLKKKPWGWISGILKKSSKKEKEKSDSESINSTTSSQFNPFTSNTSLNQQQQQPKDEKFIYKVSHSKLTNLKRPLRQQVLISNMMLRILAAHADISLSTTGMYTGYNVYTSSGINSSNSDGTPKKRRVSRSIVAPPASPTAMNSKKRDGVRRPGRSSIDVDGFPNVTATTTTTTAGGTETQNGDYDVMENGDARKFVHRSSIPLEPLIKFDTTQIKNTITAESDPIPNINISSTTSTSNTINAGNTAKVRNLVSDDEDDVPLGMLHNRKV